jgi:uncharacterized membrane protein
MEETTTSPDTLLYEAILRPQRSLSPRALFGVGAALAAGGAYMAVLMLSLGAWPVIGFTVADTALLALLLWLHHRRGRECEIIQVSEHSLRVIRIAASGQTSATDLSPAWASARLEERPGTTPRLLLGARGERIEVGRHLGDAQKRALAQALDEALARRTQPLFR